MVCGRFYEEGTKEQLCLNALDAVGLQDVCSYIKEPPDDWSNYTSTADYDTKSFNMVATPGQQYDDEALVSSNMEVPDLDSSMWHRIHSKLKTCAVHTQPIGPGGPWWGSPVTFDEESSLKYYFYATGAPFGTPFALFVAANYWHYSIYDQDDWPWETTKTYYKEIQPRRNSYGYMWDGFYRNVATPQLFYTAKSILHITYLAYFERTTEFSGTRRIYGDYRDDEPYGESSVVISPRIEKLKVNFKYNKDGFNGTYDLGNLPAASDRLIVAVQSMITKVWEVMEISNDATAQHVHMICKFYDPVL
jgi:hypothetical protein